MLYHHLLCFYAAVYFYIINLSRKPQEGDARVDNSPFLNCDSLWRNKKMLHRTLCNIYHISLYIFNTMDPPQVHSWMLNLWNYSLWYKVFIMLVLPPLLLLNRLSHVRLCATPQTAAHQAPPSMGFSRQEHWSGSPLPSPHVGSNFPLLFICKYLQFSSVQFSSVAQSCLTLCAPWIAAHQASLSIADSRSLPKLMSIESVMPSNHLIL